MYAIILLRSDVRSEVGRDKVGARAASGGEPQSSSVCNSPIELKCVMRLGRKTVQMQANYQVVMKPESTDKCKAFQQDIRKT